MKAVYPVGLSQSRIPARLAPATLMNPQISPLLRRGCHHHLVLSLSLSLLTVLCAATCFHVYYLVHLSNAERVVTGHRYFPPIWCDGSRS
jgi:hypothetical protein